MDLHPFHPPGVPGPDPVSSGWTRRVSYGPMSVDQVLARGLSEMLDEDDRERERSGGFGFVAAPRRPSLFSRLLRR
jgi:hypothetical protein